MADGINLSAYLKRIGYDGPRTPTAQTLHAITRAHAQSIPFENVDVLLHRPISLQPAAIYDKLVTRRRGGYCFEQNGLLMAVLRELGFAVRPLGARVRLGVTDRRTIPGRTHLMLAVQADGQTWLTDVGVGAASLTRALRFEADTEQATPHDRRRLQHVGERWFHQVWHGDQWVDVYEFDGTTMPLADRLIGNWYTSTSPESHFHDELEVARARPDGSRVTLRDTTLTVRQADGRADTRTIENHPALLAALHEHFAIDLPADADLGRFRS